MKLTGVVACFVDIKRTGLFGGLDKISNPGKVIRPAPQQIGSKNRRAPLVAAPYFVVEMFEAKDPVQFTAHDDSGVSSVQILVAVEGCGVVEAPGFDPVTLTKGDAVVIPAAIGNFAVRPQWAVEFLRAYVPGQLLPEPDTRL